MKEDEKRFLIDVCIRCATPLFGQDRITPREIINEPNFYIHHKRAWYLLDKWFYKGWYDYGVTLDLGWLTGEGKEKARELLKVGD